MFVRIGIHHPRQGKEAILIDSMHHLGAVAQTQPGLQRVHALRDEQSGVVIGLMIWDSREAFMAARSALAEELKTADFNDWLEGPIEMYELEEV